MNENTQAPAEHSAHNTDLLAEVRRVINHAIEQGIDAEVFLHCWRQGDWEGCAEFGFAPNLAAYAATQAPSSPLAGFQQVSPAADKGMEKAPPGAKVPRQRVDRSKAVNLARNLLEGPALSAPTEKGVRLPCEAVLRMDQELHGA